MCVCVCVCVCVCRIIYLITYVYVSGCRISISSLNNLPHGGHGGGY